MRWTLIDVPAPRGQPSGERRGRLQPRRHQAVPASAARDPQVSAPGRRFLVTSRQLQMSEQRHRLLYRSLGQPAHAPEVARGARRLGLLCGRTPAAVGRVAGEVNRRHAADPACVKSTAPRDPVGGAPTSTARQWPSSTITMRRCPPQRGSSRFATASNTCVAARGKLLIDYPGYLYQVLITNLPRVVPPWKSGATTTAGLPGKT